MIFVVYSKINDLTPAVSFFCYFVVDNARYVGLIRAAAAIWVPSSVASKDFLRKLPFYASHFSKMLFKATDLKKSVHGNFDYDVMDIDRTIASSKACLTQCS
ncbi:hypothetical protein Tco_1229562 [Tanacetum coccineum]